MNVSKAVRSVQVLNRDDAESTMSANEVLLYNSDPNPGAFIISDADEEVLIIIRFKHFIDIQSIQIYALPLDDEIEIEDASPPKQIHVFKLSNLDQDVDVIKTLKPQKSIICSPQNLSKGQTVNLRENISEPLAFKTVKYLAILMESNQNDTEFTYSHGISLNVEGTERPQHNLIESKSVPKFTKQDFDDLMNELPDIDGSDLRKGMKLLRKICSNILSDPSNPKFRDLNFSKIGERLDQCQPVLLLLFMAGFTLSADGERLQLESNESNIELIRGIQEAIGEAPISSNVNSTECVDAIKAVHAVKGDINKLCYCARTLLFRSDSAFPMNVQMHCRRCAKELTPNIYYQCVAPCICVQATGYCNVICAECYDAKVPDNVMRNVLDFGNQREAQSQLIHNKMMVTLNRIS